MKNIRIFLWVGLALILFVNFQTWQLDYAAKDAAVKVAAQKADRRRSRQRNHWMQQCPRRCHKQCLRPPRRRRKTPVHRLPQMCPP